MARLPEGGGRRGGGVGIYIDNSYEFQVLEDCSIFNQSIFESLVIEIKIPRTNKTFIIANYYRPNHPDIYSLTDQIFWINYLILSKMSLLPQIQT